jgi:tRNA threonylcarbamoyladenosine biosynthesis protein TsaB
MPLKSAPKILAFDTSSPRSSIALLEGRDVAAELRLYAPHTHSTVLLSSIDFLLGRTGWTLRQLGLVAVGTGPGSFTGIRIGIATAMGIAQSLSIPLAGISRLDALAHQVPNLDGHLAVVLDARRSQAFYAEYAGRNGRVRAVRKPALVSLSDLEHSLADRQLYIIGDIRSCRLYTSKSRRSGWPRPLEADLFLAPCIGRLALSRKRIWRSGEYLTSEPLYIRPPDALRNRIRKRRT